MPVVFSEVHDNGHEHGEGLVLVGLQDVQEIVILEETHRTVSHLQMDTTDALHDTLEETRDQMLDPVDFAHFEDLLQLSQEQGFLDAVGEWPVLKKAIEQMDGECSVLGQEEHRATEQLLVEL